MSQGNIKCDDVKAAFGDRIKHMMNLTIASGLEYGFTICEKKDGNIVEGGLCAGDRCSVDYQECESDQKDVGRIHVHPHIYSFLPSSSDVANGMRYQQGVKCVVDTKTNMSCGNYNNISTEKLNEYSLAGEKHDICLLTELQKQPAYATFNLEALGEHWATIQPQVFDSAMRKCLPKTKEMRDILQPYEYCETKV